MITLGRLFWLTEIAEALGSRLVIDVVHHQQDIDSSTINGVSLYRRGATSARHSSCYCYEEVLATLKRCVNPSAGLCLSYETS